MHPLLFIPLLLVAIACVLCAVGVAFIRWMGGLMLDEAFKHREPYDGPSDDLYAVQEEAREGVTRDMIACHGLRITVTLHHTSKDPVFTGSTPKGHPVTISRN